MARVAVRIFLRSAAKLPDLPSRLAGHPGRLALVYLGLADPLAQRLRRHPQPPRHRGDRRILRRVITSVLAHQPDRLGLGLLVVLDRHERDILPNFGSMHETRDGSVPLLGIRASKIPGAIHWADSAGSGRGSGAPLAVRSGRRLAANPDKQPPGRGEVQNEREPADCPDADSGTGRCIGEVVSLQADEGDGNDSPQYPSCCHDQHPHNPCLSWSRRDQKHRDRRGQRDHRCGMPARIIDSAEISAVNQGLD